MREIVLIPILAALAVAPAVAVALSAPPRGRSALMLVTGEPYVPRPEPFMLAPGGASIRFPSGPHQTLEQRLPDGAEAHFIRSPVPDFLIR